MHKIRFRHVCDQEEKNTINFYDGATSIQGFAQSLNIATHAYLNQEIIHKATALKGAQTFMKPAKRGSFLTEVQVLMEANPATTGFIAAYTANSFYDFLKVVYKKAVGSTENNVPEIVTIRNAMEREEPFFDEVAEALEGSLQRAHRPIGEGFSHIYIERPRSNLVTLDEETKNWVHTREESPLVDNLTGNVTRYNAITRYGRIYVDQLNRIVPFRIGQDYPFNRFGVLTWSLHGSNSGIGGAAELPKKISISATQTLSASSKVKRLVLADAFPVEANS